MKVNERPHPKNPPIVKEVFPVVERSDYTDDPCEFIAVFATKKGAEDYVLDQKDEYDDLRVEDPIPFHNY